MGLLLDRGRALRRVHPDELPTLLQWTSSGEPVIIAVVGGMFAFLGSVLLRPDDMRRSQELLAGLGVTRRTAVVSAAERL